MEALGRYPTPNIHQEEDVDELYYVLSDNNKSYNYSEKSPRQKVILNKEKEGRVRTSINKGPYMNPIRLSQDKSTHIKPKESPIHPISLL